MQHLQPLLCWLHSEHVAHARKVAARSVQAGDQALLDRIAPDIEDNRDRGSRRLGRLCGRSAGRGNHADLTTNEIGRQSRQAIVLVVRPAVFKRHVLPLDKASFAEPLAERAQTVRKSAWRCGVEKPDHRHRRLLRTSRERPRCRAAEQGDELAPHHGLHLLRLGPHITTSVYEWCVVHHSKIVCRMAEMGQERLSQASLRSVRGSPHYGHASACRARLFRATSRHAPAHSISSSARASSVGGSSRPSALAVLKLMTNSNLVGACTGKSAGFSPLRMRST
jgi:hypothetical protein